MLVPYATILAFLAAAVSAQQNDPSINTPTGVEQCQVIKLTWYGTHPPFEITALPGGQAGGTPLEDILASTSDQDYSWLCNLSQGTYFTLRIRDSQGSLQYSSPVTVGNGSNSSCVGQTPSTTPGSNSTTTTTTTSGAATSGAITSGARNSTTQNTATTSKSSGTTTTGTTTSSSTSSTHSGGAMPTAAAQWGVAGLLGLMGAAVLA